MLAAFPMRVVYIIYVAAAVLPALFLLRYIYRMDRHDKEPLFLLIRLLLMGVAAAIASIVLETIGTKLLPLAVEPDTKKYTIALAFGVVAVVEEGTKFIFLKYRTWNNTNFDHTFDAIVYSVFVSLGFAAFENVKYVMSYGLSVALPRAVLAIPGHMGFAVFMGIFYGRAKMCEKKGNLAGRRANLFFGYLISVFLHGFYDSCAMIGTGLATMIFVAFVLIMYIVVIRTVKKESSSDRRI